MQVYQGNHKAKATSGRHIVSDALGLLHFHETGTYRQYERALQGVKGYKHVDTNKSFQIYKEWLKMTRPAPGPDGLRRPLWLTRPLRPVTEMFYIK